VQLRDQSRKFGRTEWGPTVILRRKKFVSAMSHMGQQRSSNDVCVTSAITPTTPRRRTFRLVAFVPIRDQRRCSKITLFDHLVGGGEERLRDIKSERFRGFQIDYKFVFCRLLKWQVSGFLAVQNAIDVVSR
jgi:hypothetical protein